MSSLDPSTKNRLVKLLGMLGSDHDGERANAAHAADKLLRQNGLTWREWIEGRQKPREPEPAGVGILDAIERCLGCPEMLNEWERRFLGDVRARAPDLTEKQLAKVEQIYRKVRTYRGFAGA